MKEEIKNLLKNKKIITKLYSEKPCRDRLDIKKYLEDILKDIPEYLTTQNLLSAIKNDVELKHCKTFGKLLDYKQTFFWKREYCSHSCSRKFEIGCA